MRRANGHPADWTELAGHDDVTIDHIVTPTHRRAQNSSLLMSWPSVDVDFIDRASGASGSSVAVVVVMLCYVGSCWHYIAVSMPPPWRGQFIWHTDANCRMMIIQSSSVCDAVAVVVVHQMLLPLQNS